MITFPNGWIDRADRNGVKLRKTNRRTNNYVSRACNVVRQINPKEYQYSLTHACFLTIPDVLCIVTKCGPSAKIAVGATTKRRHACSPFVSLGTCNRRTSCCCLHTTTATDDMFVKTCNMLTNHKHDAVDSNLNALHTC
jgi:hypothetical protein